MSEHCTDDTSGCPIVCDFCAFFDFNGNEHGWYMGNGWCRLHQKKKDPISGCNDFECFTIKENGASVYVR